MHHHQLKSTEMNLCTCVPASNCLACQKSKKIALWAEKTFSLGREKKLMKIF